jgi:hypothetical protein|nr:MAG TPA: hypothetical protein [Caudoviricetes sp.]
MLYKEISIYYFEPWSGAVNTYERLKREGKLDELDSLLPDMFGKDDVEETELNDLLWFEPNTVYELVGLPTESEIREDIEYINERIEDEESAINDLEMDMTEYEEGTGKWQDIEIEIFERLKEIENLKEEKQELFSELNSL